MRKLTILIITIFFISCNNGGNIQNMTKRLDQLDKDELETMVENAKKEIDNENFSTATKILDKAKSFVTDNDDENLLAETNSYYRNGKLVYDEKIRKEKERQRRIAEARRRKEENDRISSSNYSNNDNYYSNEASFCYKITDKDTNPFHNKITYTIECGNGNSKYIKYNPDKYPPYGIVPSFGFPDFKYKSLDDAAKSYCNCD